MKKTILVSLSMLMILTQVNAQNSNFGFKKGEMYLSGMFAVSSTTIDKEKSTTFELEPSFGYMLTNNLAAGVSFGYGMIKNKLDTIAFNDDNTAISGGLFATYYFNPGSRYSFYGTAGFDYLSINDKFSKIKTTGFDISIVPGINYFVSKKLALQASVGRLGFTTTKADTRGADPISRIDLNMDFSTGEFGVILKL